MWSDKYCPRKITEILSNEIEFNGVIKNWKQFFKNNYFFHGSHGIGKTIFCLILCHLISIKNSRKNVLIIDGLKEIELVELKKKLKGFIDSKFCKDSSYKIVLIDNLDRLSFSGQLYLRENMEKAHKGYSFWLIGRFLTRINPTILSRCLIVNLKPISSLHGLIRISEISFKERMKGYIEPILGLMSDGAGDLRKMINLCFQDIISSKKNNFSVFTSSKKFSEFFFYKIWESKQKDEQNVFIRKIDWILKKKKTNLEQERDKLFSIFFKGIDLNLNEKKYFFSDLVKNSFLEFFLFFFSYTMGRNFYFKKKRL